MAQNISINYHFTVDWGGTRIGFMEVSGLDIEIEAISYRDGSSKDDSFINIPGLKKFSNIILKRGIVSGDNEFFSWINSKQMGIIEKRDIVISLLNENHEPVVSWKVSQAFPVKYSGPALKANSSEVAIETLELTHEGFSIMTSKK